MPLCGVRAFFADELCPECLKIATVKYRELGVTLGEQGAEEICFETGRPCPTGEEKEALLQRILLRPE